MYIIYIHNVAKDNMKTINYLKDFCITLFITICSTKIIEIVTGVDSKIQFIIFFLIFGLVLIVIEIIRQIVDGNVKAKIDLWKNGKIKGLWEEKGLIRQIEKGFRESDEVKIKVTRGYDLFQPDQEYGFVNILNEIKKKNRNVNIKFLLIMPCYKEDHVQQRYERHTGVTKEVFLETWYKSIAAMKEYSNEYLSLNVRFYMSKHARWRFYIFSKKNNYRTNVLLADYDRDTPGSGHPMYKIIKKDRNIAAFMTSYFDELWDGAMTPKELLRLIEKEKCVRYICGNCRKEEKCSSCLHIECEYKDLCKRLVTKYRDDLRRFNVR